MSYWVMPPPENRPTEYGRPMLMTYSVSQEHYLSQDALNEMVKAFNFIESKLLNSVKLIFTEKVCRVLQRRA